MSNESTRRGELPAELSEFTSLARGSLGRMSPEQSRRGEFTVVSNFSARATRRPVWLVPAAAALLATSALAVLFARHRAESAALSYVIDKSAALSYVIDNRSSSSGADRSLDVENGPPRTVRFSDGTEVRVAQGTRARIRSVTNHGAELAMSRGMLHAEVVHSATSEWRFDAGPFVVHVTGTAFSLEWEPELDRFDLRLEHGSVSVSSPVNDTIQVREGQWLTIRPRNNEVFIRALEAPASNDAGNDEAEPLREPDAPSPDRDAEPTVAASSNAMPKTALPATRASDASHTWARDLLHGKADRIVDDALRRGLDGCLADSSPSELAALGDAARYTRRNEVARRVLLTERRRFPGSPTAMEAALFLGRLAAAEQNDGQALGWFNTYLAEAPGGAHAPEALGRKMAIVRHSGVGASARALAEEYLEKYPDGTYSSAARAILKSP